MEGKLIDLDFIFVGFKFTGRFDECPTLIPQAVKEVIEKNHEIGLVKIFIFCLRVVLVRLLQRLDHVMGSDEINGVPLLNRLQRQGNGQMGFPDSRRSQKDQILLMLDKPQGGQIPNAAFIDGRLESEIELVQRLMERQMGHSRFHPDKPFPFGRKLLLQQLVQKLQIRYIVFSRFFSVGMEDFRYPAPSELLESILEAFLQDHCTVTASFGSCS